MALLRKSLTAALLLIVGAVFCVTADVLPPLVPTNYITTSVGVKIAIYESAGGLDDDKFFLLHGNSLSSGIYQNLLNSPKFGLKHKVIAMDFPGCGNSEDASDSSLYSIDNLALIAIEVMKTLNMDNGILVGHSLGGVVAMQMMPQLDNVKGLVLLAGPALHNPLSDNPFAFAANPAVPLLFTPSLTEEQVAILAPANFAPGYDYPSWVETDIRRTDVDFRPTISAGLNAGDYTDQYEVLQSLNIPVLLLGGSQDQLINITTFLGAQAQAISFPSTGLRAGVGHTPSVEDPNWVISQISTQFVNIISSGQLTVSQQSSRSSSSKQSSNSDSSASSLKVMTGLMFAVVFVAAFL